MSEYVITKIDGDDHWSPSVEFVIQIDDKTLSRLPHQHPDKSFSILGTGELRIICKDPKDNMFLGSVSLDCGLLPRSEASWLPLLTKMNDRISELPCRELAMVWIQLTPARILLKPVLEVTEPSCSDPASFNSNSSIANLSEADDLQLLLNEEKAKNLDLESQLNRTFSMLENTSKDFQAKESVFNTEIKNKDEVIETLKAQIDSLSCENLLLKSQIRSASLTIEKFRDVEEKAKKDREELEQCKKTLEDTQKQLKEVLEKKEALKLPINSRPSSAKGSSSKPSPRPMVKAPSKKKLKTTHGNSNLALQKPAPTKNLSSNKSNSAKRTLANKITPLVPFEPIKDEVDIALQKKLNELGRSGLLVKEEENIYSIGKRKVFIELREGKIVCRAAGGFKTLEEYIDYYVDHDTSFSLYSSKLDSEELSTSFQSIQTEKPEKRNRSRRNSSKDYFK